MTATLNDETRSETRILHQKESLNPETAVLNLRMDKFLYVTLIAGSLWSSAEADSTMLEQNWVRQRQEFSQSTRGRSCIHKEKVNILVTHPSLNNVYL